MVPMVSDFSLYIITFRTTNTVLTVILPFFPYFLKCPSFFCPEYGWEGFAGSSALKNPPAKAGDVGSIPQLGRSPEKEMATYFNILA